DFREVVDAVRLPHLERLELKGVGVPGAALRALCDGDRLPALTHLRLSHCRIGPDDMAGLVDAPGTARLLALELPHNQIGEGVEVLKWAPLSRLRSLDLADNEVWRSGIQAVLRAIPFDALHALSLAHATLPPEDCE